jgi:hypothetical protein
MPDRVRGERVGPEEVHMVVAERVNFLPAAVVHSQHPDAATTIVRADGDGPGQEVVVVPFATHEANPIEMANVLKRQHLQLIFCCTCYYNSKMLVDG